MTSQLQVLDVVVNKPFKDHLQKKYSDWQWKTCIESNKQVEETKHTGTGPVDKYPSGKIKSEFTVNGFKKCMHIRQELSYTNCS